MENSVDPDQLASLKSQLSQIKGYIGVAASAVFSKALILLLTSSLGFFLLLLWIICYLYLVFIMLSCLFIAALWSPSGKGLTSWLLFLMSYCDFVTFPCGILGQVWYLIVLIPDLCSLSYFVVYGRSFCRFCC